MSIVLGIDIGATGIKGNLVDTEKGEVIEDRIKIATPSKSTPKEVIKVLRKIIKGFNWEDKQIGIGFPSIIHNGVTVTAANVDNSWAKFPAEIFFKEELGDKIRLVNDADAAGIAELHFGAAKDVMGTIILLTLGTGIGSAIFRHGLLVPNTELGHLIYKKSIAEHYAANSAREKKDLSYKEWGGELQKVLLYIEHLFSPDLFIIGGGISKKFHKYEDYLKKVNADIVPAKMRNDAGIIGAAMSHTSKDMYLSRSFI